MKEIIGTVLFIEFKHCQVPVGKITARYIPKANSEILHNGNQSIGLCGRIPYLPNMKRKSPLINSKVKNVM